jgi:outer membrane lipoprotein-sorting protein
MRKNVTTLPNGEARLKDYDVFKCIADKDKMEVMYYDEKMTLTYEELTSKRVSTSDKTYKSQFAGGKDYKLLGYDWNPDEIEL